MTRRFPNPWLAPTCTGRRTYAREEKVMVPSSPPNPKSANLEVHNLDNCAECKYLRGRQDNDTYADLADSKCTPPSRHPTEEGYAN